MNMNIGKKIAAGFGVVILLLIVISFVGIQDLKSVTKGYQVEVITEKNIAEKSEKIQIYLLQIRRNEKDFMARKDMKYPERVNKYLDLAYTVAEEIENTTANKVILPKLKEIETEIASYKSEFEKLVQVVVARGLNQNDGAQGEFRKAAHSFETAIKEVIL